MFKKAGLKCKFTVSHFKKVFQIHPKLFFFFEKMSFPPIPTRGGITIWRRKGFNTEKCPWGFKFPAQSLFDLFSW